MTYTEFTAKIEPLEVGREILIAELSDIGFESFVESDTGLQAYIQTAVFNPSHLTGLSILANPDFSISYELLEIADENWNKKWEESFDPINVEGECLVRAPFHESQTSVTYDIVIDPKMSFGTGHHATTYLMISELIKMPLEGASVLDMGCGTGVLAILAHLKGAANIVAIDIDDWAYENTIENVRNNNCEAIEVIKGGAEQINVKFDVILANINRNILLADMPTYVRAMNNDGHLFLSGFFETDVQLILDSATALGLKLANQQVKEEWCMLHLKLDDEKRN